MERGALRAGRGALLVVVAGCNPLFGIESTRAIDAAPREYFDAPTDAPFSCPPPGQTPAYSPLLRQVIAQDCKHYSTSTDRQVGAAICNDDNFQGYTGVAIGPIDEPLAEVTELYDPAFEAQFLRMSADGDLLIITYYDFGTGYEIRSFDRQQDGSWVRGPDVLTPASYVDVSAPTRKPRHVLRTSNDSQLHELVQDDTTGVWTEVATHDASELGVGVLMLPKLSADGLRLMLVDGGRIVYSDRAALGSPFRAATPLTGVPYVFDAFMTEDCSRVYFSGLQQILYLQQL